MTRYLVRHVGSELILSTLEVTAADNVAIPADASVLTEATWAKRAAPAIGIKPTTAQARD